MTLEELRLFARRHAFGGFGVIDGSSPSSPSSPSSSVCVRHHWIDWNFIGPMRPRPNKWRIELKDDGASECFFFQKEREFNFIFLKFRYL